MPGTTYLSVLQRPVLQDLRHTLILVACAKLILESRLASRIVGVLGPVSVGSMRSWSSQCQPSNARQDVNGRHLTNLLVGNENLEATDNLSQWNRPITLPFLHCFWIIHQDYKVVLFALVMNFRLAGTSTGHFEGSSTS